MAPVKETTFDPPPSPASTDTVKRKSIFVCATAVRAGVKTVDCRYSGTGVQLSNLKVERVSDKVCPDEHNKPLWAVETSSPFCMSFDPLWGIVSDRHEKTDGIHTMRSEKLWLPETVSQRVLFGARAGSGSTAAAAGPVMNVYSIYHQSFDLDSLTGVYSYPIAERYRRLSANETTTASQTPAQSGSGNPNEPTSEWVEGDGQLMLAFGRIGTKDSSYFVKLQRDGETVPEARGRRWLRA